MCARIAVVTIADDFHAHVIKHELNTRKEIKCIIIEVDKLSSAHSLSWRLCGESTDSRITVDKTEVSLSEIDLVWWRRVTSSQLLPFKYPDDQKYVIDKDCQSAFLGAFISSFSGKWISHPWYTEHANNKLYQTSLAKREGFKVPRTLVSQYPDDVRAFCDSNENGTIVKMVASGRKKPLIFTEFITSKQLAYADDSIDVSPAIYQEYIIGTTHIRLNCFGANSFAARIETADLDWRRNLNIPIESWPVPERLHKMVRRVLDALNLEMGVVDLKITPNGEVYWLEVNPQGQFLFLEPLTGDPYVKIFSDYLVNEALNL